VQVIVIGAGITGLSTAWALARSGVDVTVLEASSRVGGAMASARDGGYLVELGPSALAETPMVTSLIRELGLDLERVTPSAAARRRYVVRGGALVPVPTSPRGVLRSPLLSPWAKLRMLAEPAIPRGHDASETAAGFVRRRLGREVLDYVANPVIAGIYAGDPEGLLARHVCGGLVAWEREYGSLFAGARRAPMTRRSLLSFREGLGALPRGLARALGAAVHLNSRARALEPHRGRWIIECDDEAHEADAVVCAGPVSQLAELALPRALAEALAPVRRLPAASLITVSLAFATADVPHPLDGFGLLVPSVEPASILGAFFASTVFEGRAPALHTLLTCFLGGARHPQAIHEPDAVLIDRALADLRRLLGVRAAPTYVRLERWLNAIPQYDAGYDRVTRAIEAVEQVWLGLRFVGAYRAGISIPDRIAAGFAAGGDLVAFQNAS
jgi:protoporphyrinogen/coproporphyrinogen III oxidase